MKMLYTLIYKYIDFIRDYIFYKQSIKCVEDSHIIIRNFISVLRKIVKV